MGTSLDAGSLPLAEVRIDAPTVLVLGNEGHGVRTNVARACDLQVRDWFVCLLLWWFAEACVCETTCIHISSASVGRTHTLMHTSHPFDAQVRIEGGGRGQEVDSLNVSVTGGILMHFLRASGGGGGDGGGSGGGGEGGGE